MGIGIPKFEARVNEPDRDQAIEGHEQKLSQEILEQVMEKVRDIDEPGIAYSAIIRRPNEPEKLRSVLNDGILGMRRSRRHTEDTEVSRERWRQEVRQKDDRPLVYFNIVGRAHDLMYYRIDDKEKTRREINISYYVQLPGNKTIILFDSQFAEEKNHPKYASPPYKKKEVTESDKKIHRTFGVDDQYARRLYDIELPFSQRQEMKGLWGDKLIPESERGFVLTSRVAPRYFQGIVFKVARVRTEEEVRKELKRTAILLRISNSDEMKMNKERIEIQKRSIDEDRPEKWDQRAQELAETMMEANQKKPQQLVPIYDVYGNLYWPKKMSYEEVKQYVASRRTQQENTKK